MKNKKTNTIEKTKTNVTSTKQKIDVKKCDQILSSIKNIDDFQFDNVTLSIFECDYIFAKYYKFDAIREKRVNDLLSRLKRENDKSSKICKSIRRNLRKLHHRCATRDRSCNYKMNSISKKINFDIDIDFTRDDFYNKIA